MWTAAAARSIASAETPVSLNRVSASADDPRCGRRERHQHEPRRELGVLPRHLAQRHLGPVAQGSALSKILTSTGDWRSKASASSRVPIWLPQCMGIATCGWIRRAASAASPEVIT